MTALEWRYKRRDDSTGAIVQEDWRPRPEGSTMYELYDLAGTLHSDVQAVESRPAQEVAK